MEAIVLFDYSAQENDELNLKVGDNITNVIKVSEGWCEGILNGKKGAFPDNFVKMIRKEEVKDVQKRPNAPVVAELRKQLSSVIGVPQPQLPVKKTFNKKVKVTHQYIPQNDDEISLEIGQIVEVLKEDEPGWWEGNCNGKIGMFPSNFVEVIEGDVKNAPTDEITPEIKGRKVQGIGFGPNIFGMSGINLKPVGMGNRGQNEAPKNLNASIAQPVPKKPVVNVSAEEKSQIKAKVLFSYTAENEDELTMEIGDIITVIEQNLEDVGWWKGELHGKIGVFPDNFVEVIHEEKIKAVLPPANGVSNLKTTINQTSLDKITKKDDKTPPSKIEFPLKPNERDSKLDVLNIVQTTELLNNPNANRVHGPPARKPPSNFAQLTPKPDIKDIKKTPLPNNPKVPPQPVISKKNEEIQNKPTIIKNTDENHIISNAYVTRENYNELQKEMQNLREQLESLRRNHDRRYNELLSELEQEKKFRLLLQGEVERLNKLLPESNA